jgi:hypothetical protein
LRTVVYVDGYNLYYGLLRKTTLKWLDLFALFRDHVLDHEVELIQVRYYTAPVLGRMCDSLYSRQRLSSGWSNRSLKPQSCRRFRFMSSTKRKPTSISHQT